MRCDWESAQAGFAEQPSGADFSRQLEAWTYQTQPPSPNIVFVLMLYTPWARLC